MRILLGAILIVWCWQPVSLGDKWLLAAGIMLVAYSVKEGKR